MNQGPFITGPVPGPGQCQPKMDQHGRLICLCPQCGAEHTKDKLANLDRHLADYWLSIEDGEPVANLLEAMRIVADDGGTDCKRLLAEHDGRATHWRKRIRE